MIPHMIKQYSSSQTAFDVITVQHLVKKYGGFVAAYDVSFSIRTLSASGIGGFYCIIAVGLNSKRLILSFFGIELAISELVRHCSACW